MKNVVLYNPDSSNYGQFDELVREPLGDDADYLEVEKTFDGTIEKIANHPDIANGDCVIACGGDGTLAAILNGLMRREQQFNLKMMPLGKYNDTLWSLGQESKPLNPDDMGTPHEFAPIDLCINGQHAYYALHEFCIGHLATLGTMLDDNSRAAAAGGKKQNVIKMILDYYFQTAKQNPQGDLPKELPNITSVTLGRIGGKWSPRIDGNKVRGLHRGNEFAIIGQSINGSVTHDIGRLAAWTPMGIPAQLADNFDVALDEPRNLQILIDGEIMDFSDVEKISAQRVPSNVRLYYN